MSDKKFALYTKSMLKKLPYWFKIRKDAQGSIGAKFLDVFGFELDDIRYMLDYAFAQTKIASIDLEQTDILYKAEINDSLDINKITSVFHSMGGLTKADTLQDFFGLKAHELNEPMIYDKPYYFLDETRKLIYVHYSYDKNKNNKYGSINIEADGEIYSYPLTLHHVWNFLDEFGMLVDCKRLYEEKNIDYKKRILDVFINIANSSKVGLLNGIARELSLRNYKTWEDGSEDYIIKDKMVILNQIYVDGNNISLEDVYINKDGDIVLLGNWKYKDVVRTVEYVSGIELHQLSNENDIPLYNQLVNIDGTATDMLKRYVNTLKTIAPIDWGDFVWNEAYWNFSDEDQSGMAYMSNLYDAKITGFKKYKRQTL